MGQAKDGDTVSIHYTGRLDDGTVFDSSENRDPLQFQLGAGQVIAGFEEAVEGMEEGEQKTAAIPSGDAYGERRDDLIITVPQEQLPDEMEPQVGQQLQMQSADGQTFQVVIAEIGEETVDLDANHPLAGKDLTFDIELVDIA